MNAAQNIKNELNNYLILSAELKERFAGLDDETLTDTLEGASGLHEAIAGVVRSSLQDEALIEALKARLEDLGARLERLKGRYEKKRSLACWAMQEAGLSKVLAEDLSVGLRKGSERLEVLDEAKVPLEYFVLQPAKLDRKSLGQALKGGKTVEGARLSLGEDTIQVRVR